MDRQKKSYNKFIHILTSIVFYTVIFSWLVFTVSNQHVKKTSDIATIFGQGMLSAQSNSMSGNQVDSFTTGDLLLVEMLDNEKYLNLRVGDVITYYDESTRQLITQRIINTFLVEDALYLETQGDHEQAVSNLIPASEVLALYKSKVERLGTKLDYLQTPKGYALFIMIPALTILLYELLIFTRSVLNIKKLRFENSFEKRYKEALKSLEIETTRIRQKILSNWVTK